MNAENHIIVITGGASGLGKATAVLWAKLGAKVGLLDVDMQQAEQLANKIGAKAFYCDVSDANSAEAAVAAVASYYGKITGCINCAGVAPSARLVGRDGPHNAALFSRIISINLTGTFNLLRLCSAQMLKQEPITAGEERGVIINTASIAAFEGQVGQAAYSASKGGVVAMTLPAARELGKYGVRVVTIAPGVIATPMMDAMPVAVQKSLQKSVAFPKRLGEPEEYAKLTQAIFDNHYLNGCVIRLDGGIRMSEQ